MSPATTRAEHGLTGIAWSLLSITLPPIIGMVWTWRFGPGSLILVFLAGLIIVATIRYDVQLDLVWRRFLSRVRRRRRTHSRPLGAASRKQRVAVRWLGRAGMMTVLFGVGVTIGSVLDRDSAPDTEPLEPVTALVSNDVEMRLEAMNLTSGEERYSESPSVVVDDVIQIQLTYSNEGDSLRGVSVGFRLSEPKDGTQYVKADVDIDGSTDTLALPVDLSLDDGALQIMPESVLWRSVSGSTGEPVDQRYDNQPGQLVELEQVASGQAGSVTVLIRYSASALSVRLEAMSPEHPEQSQNINASAGDEVRLVSRISNAGNQALRGVVVRAHLAPGMLYVPGSTQEHRGEGSVEAPDGVVDPVDPVGGSSEGFEGFLIDELAVGEEALISWLVRLPDDAEDATYCVVASARPLGMNEFRNTAVIGVPHVPDSC